MLEALALVISHPFFQIIHMILFDNHRPSFSLDMMSLVDLNWVSLQHVSPLFVSTFYMSPGRFQFFWSTFF